MPTAFFQEIEPGEDRGTTNYDAITAAVDVAGNPPEGLLIHTAGFSADGTFRIYDVWETREQLDRFMEDRLMPVVEAHMAQVMDADSFAEPKQEIFELHDCFARG